MRRSFLKLSSAALFTALLAGCNPPADTSMEAETEAEVDVTAEQSMSLSFVDLMRLGEDYTCTFTDAEGSSRTDGTVYVAGNGTRLRGDFTVRQSNGETMDASVIRDGTTNYVWTSEAEQGFRMQVDEDAATLFGDTEASEQSGIKDGEPVDFRCTRWTPDEAMFTPPADREFVDFSAQMDAMMEAAAGMQVQGGDVKAAQCAACAQIPDAGAQQQCRTALGC